MRIKESRLFVFYGHMTVFFVVIFFILFPILIGLSAPFGRSQSIASEVAMAQYASIAIMLFFSIIFSIIVLLFIHFRSHDHYIISFFKPLIGFILYTVAISLYFYDLIYLRSFFVNNLLSLVSIYTPPAGIVLWSSDDLFNVRLIDSLTHGFLLYYGFFSSQVILVNDPLKIGDVIIITLLLFIIFFMLVKVVATGLSGSITLYLLLFFVPFISIKLLSMLRYSTRL